MKIAVVTGRKRFEIREVPTPKVLPGTLLVKVKRCAICGTDLEYVDHVKWDEKNKDGSPILHEAVLGHEWVGEVVEVGKGVEGWSVGDRAVDLMRLVPCGKCYWCRRGLQHLCMGGRVRGRPLDLSTWASMSGTMAEYVLKWAQTSMKVPDSVSDEEAALTEPLNVGLSPIYEAGIKAGDSVAILGGGHIGQLTLLAAKAAGAAPIIVTDRIKSRLDKALELGADYALNSDEGNVSERIQDITEAGADTVIICVRGADVTPQAMDVVRREGTIVVVGYPKPAILEPVLVQTKHIKIIGCDPLLKYNLQAMKLMEYKRINCKPLISEIMPLKDVKQAFDSLYAGKNLLVMLAP